MMKPIPHLLRLGKRGIARYAYCLLSTAYCLLIGCQKNVVTDITVVNVKKEFSIVPWEQLNIGGGKLQLIATSISPQNCTGTTIDYYSALVNDKLSFTFKNYIVPTTCDGVQKTVSDTLDVATLPNGTYKLHINLKDAVLNEGSLVVDDTHYQFSMSSENGIVLPNKTLLRVPSKAIWGYVGFADPNGNKANAALDSLKSISTPLYGIAGNYNYFTLDASNQVDFVADNKKPNLIKFIFKLSQDDPTLSAAIARISSLYGQQVEIKVFTSEGKVY